MINKPSYLVIFTIILIHTISIEHQHMENNQKEQTAENERKYKYLYPSQKISAGFFKSYQFDLRFPEIRGAPVSKNMFEGSIDYLSFKFSHETTGKRTPTTEEDFQFIQKELPMVPTNFKEQTEKDIRYTWIGHATAVIQIGPDNFIIDPIMTEKKAKRRYRPAACKVDQLPRIDVVLISHDHTDHFDCKTINQIHETFNPIYVAGLGTQDILPKDSKKEMMDWMQETTLNLKGGQYKITFVPACHWSRRGFTDLNTRLWGGFVIESPFGHKVYYSGDTGYAGVFEEIGDKFGPFDLAILPIGAYQPRDFLKYQHINPEEAVKIHKEIKSSQSVGVHWGTFSVGRQGFAQPKYDLQKACKQHNLKQGEFITIKHGESRVFSKRS